MQSNILLLRIPLNTPIFIHVLQGSSERHLFYLRLHAYLEALFFFGVHYDRGHPEYPHVA